MTLSGLHQILNHFKYLLVLIPLLVDDPLRGMEVALNALNLLVLIPLLVDDPLRALNFTLAQIETMS